MICKSFLIYIQLNTVQRLGLFNLQTDKLYYFSGNINSFCVWRLQHNPKTFKTGATKDLKSCVNLEISLATVVNIIKRFRAFRRTPFTNNIQKYIWGGLTQFWKSVLWSTFQIVFFWKSFWNQGCSFISDQCVKCLRGRVQLHNHRNPLMRWW